MVLSDGVHEAIRERTGPSSPPAVSAVGAASAAPLGLPLSTSIDDEVSLLSSIRIDLTCGVGTVLCISNAYDSRSCAATAIAPIRVRSSCARNSLPRPSASPVLECNVRIARVPTEWPAAARMNVKHAMSCSGGVFRLASSRVQSFAMSWRSGPRSCVSASSPPVSTNVARLLKAAGRNKSTSGSSSAASGCRTLMSSSRTPLV